MSNSGLEPLNRPLIDDERNLTLWLIEHGTSKSKPELKSQVDHLTVYERCTCGCPTVYFALDGVPVPRKGEAVVSDHFAMVDSQDVGVMLFETSGKLSSLEVYSCGGSDQPFGLPKVETIRPS